MNQMGGIAFYDAQAALKSSMLYDFIDGSGGYYRNVTDKKFRSRMNINFRIANRDLEEKFIAQAESIKIINIKGHPFNPGIRISIYNAMPQQGVAYLIAFMKKFMRENP